MADEIIKHSDLIDPNAIPQIGKDAQAALVYIAQLEDGLRRLATALGKKLNSPTTTAAEMKSQIDAIEKISAAERSQIAILEVKARLQKEQILFKDGLTKANKAEAEAAKKLADEQKKANKVSAEQAQLLKLNEKLAKAAKGSYNALSAELGIVTMKWKKLSQEERENTKEGRALTATKLKLTEQLKELDAKTGVHVRNVGAYHLALGKLGKGIKGVTGILGELGAALGFDTEIMERFVNVGSTVSKTLKEIHHAENLKKIATHENTVAEVENTAATIENTAATEENIAAKEELVAANEDASGASALNAEAEAAESAGAAMGPLAVGLVAVGGALYLLNQYLTQSSEETKKLEKENEELKKTTERLHVITEAQIKVGDAYIESLKAQGAPLQKIREEQEKLNALKNEDLLRNIALIKQSITVNKSKIQDISTNNSLYESYLKFGYAQAKIFGLTDKMNEAQKLIDENKKERAKDFVEELNKQQEALITAQADYDAFQYSIITQNAEFNKEEEKLDKEAIEKKKKHYEDLMKMYKADRDAKIKAEEEKYQYLLGLKKRIEALELSLVPEKDEFEQEQQRYEDQLNELDRIAEDAKDAGQFSQDRYNRDREAIEQKHFENLGHITDNANLKIGEQIEEDNKKKIALDKKLYEEKKKLLDEHLKEAISAQEKLLDAVKQAYSNRNSEEDAYFAQRKENIDNEIKVQQDQFNKGLDNTLAYEKAERAKYNREKIAAERQQRQREENLQLAALFLELEKTYASEGLSGAAKAFAQTMAAKGIANVISGSAFDGVEDTGDGSGRGVDGKGGMYWILHPKERVVPKVLNEKIDGMSNEELVNKALAFENIYLPQLAGSLAPDEVKQVQQGWKGEAFALNGMIKELGDKLEKGLSSIESTKWDLNKHNQWVKTVIKNGIREEFIFQNPRSG